jgi:1-acyl-sn-glycerol-3-phosphate acyltransferase
MPGRAAELRLIDGDATAVASPGGDEHDRSLGAIARRRVRGDYEIDPWGLDHDLADLLVPLWKVRFGLEIDGANRLPADGPVLLVANRRVGASEPFVLARGIRQATGRHVRCVGMPDVQPVGSVLRRLGGVLARPDEVGGLLRAGEVVAVFLDRQVWRAHGAGGVPPELFAPAFDLGVPVVPVALLGRELSRRWRVRLGAPIEHPDERGPLAMVELADRARARVQAMLDEAVLPGWF